MNKATKAVKVICGTCGEWTGEIEYISEEQKADHVLGYHQSKESCIIALIKKVLAKLDER